VRFVESAVGLRKAQKIVIGEPKGNLEDLEINRRVVLK
jgi:hypothetical protein